MSKSAIRLFCNLDLRNFLMSGNEITLNNQQRHYLIDVLRCKINDPINLIDGFSGEYQAYISTLRKNEIGVKIIKLLRISTVPADLCLLFAPLKKSRTELIVEKCVELGVKQIKPIVTEFTNVKVLNSSRLKQVMKSSAQQCGCTYLPILDEIDTLDNVLNNWESERTIIFCSEKNDGSHIGSVLPSLTNRPMAILIGPEGGFSRHEAEKLKLLNFVRTVSLGPQILRADTAAIASISIWQTICGFWDSQAGKR